MFTGHFLSENRWVSSFQSNRVVEEWTLVSQNNFCFFLQWRSHNLSWEKIWSINHFGPKGSKSDRRFEKWFHWFQESENFFTVTDMWGWCIFKRYKIPCEKHKKKTDPKIIFYFCIYLHKDRCAKNSSLLSWWQPTTQLKMPKTQKSSARSGPTLHHIGVQTRGISDRVRSTGIPNGWVSTEN